MSGGKTSFIVPNNKSDTGIKKVDIIIVLMARRLFRPAISTRAGLANTDPAVVVANKIIVTSAGAPLNTQIIVTIAGMMNICHETIVHVKVSTFDRICAGLSSRVFREKTTTKKSAMKTYGKHASASAGKTSPAPMAIAISIDDHARSLENELSVVKMNPRCRKP